MVLGTGQGFTVLQVIDAFSQAWGQPLPYTFTERRPGDIEEYFADTSKATKELGFKAVRSLEQMMQDCLR